MQRGTPSRYRPDGVKYTIDDYVLMHGRDEMGQARARDDWLAASTVLQWYHNGKATCVGYGPPDDFCNSSQLVCAAAALGEYGNYDQQAKEAE